MAKTKRQRERQVDGPIFRLPPYKVESVFAARAQVIDWGIDAVGIPNLWKSTRGAGVRVAVLDTGIAMNHVDLKDAIEDGKDFTRSASGWGDVQGHGTHVAGTIAARDNTTGVVGVAPDCRLLIGKVLGDNGSGSSAGVAAGILWAIEQKAHVISMSLGSPQPDGRIKEAIDRALEAGVFVVAAAGNEGPNLNTVGWPASYDGVISVGAIDRQKRVTRFSSRGKRVDIVAPGDAIVSTFPPNGLASLSGTSMATPLVAGVVALIIAKHLESEGESPVDTPAELLEHLRRTAIDIDAPGFDVNAGWGLIDPEKLLALVPDKPPVPPPGTAPDGAVFDPSDFTPAGRAKLAVLTGVSSVTVRLR